MAPLTRALLVLEPQNEILSACVGGGELKQRPLKFLKINTSETAEDASEFF